MEFFCEKLKIELLNPLVNLLFFIKYLNESLELLEENKSVENTWMNLW